MEQIFLKKEPEELDDNFEEDVLMNNNKSSILADQEMPSTSGIALKQEIKEELDDDDDNSMLYNELGVKEESETYTDKVDNLFVDYEAELKFEAEDEIFLDRGNRKKLKEMKESALKNRAELKPAMKNKTKATSDLDAKIIREKRTEAKRIERQKIRADPEAYERMKAYERERSRKRRESGKLKSIAEKNPKEQQIQRKQWNLANKRYYERKKKTLTEN
ncbi:unnamed protein product [Brassicogethes aeneus]|uniref:Uncharacterized protein n=1 Tax=Brassicogethes aeneus TaxID=1431903 RepID=A0A9P0FBW6_BRAAE|nr:unnamed protein product [Brassicogethes aeneus]